jgi:hypothetical protein
VAIGVGRPGKASSAAGISTFFRNVNMSAPPAYHRNISLGALPRSRNWDHVFRSAGAAAVRGLAGRYARYGPRSGAILPLTIDKEQAAFLAAPMKVFPAPLVALAVKSFAVLSVEVDWGTLLPRTHNSTCDSSVRGQRAQ